jgi:anti-anti-sigma factor
MIDEFSITITYGDGDGDGAATVAIGGELDMLSAPALDAALTALVDNGYADIVVDLEAVTFMDARGADVFARIAERAASAEATFVLRSTPAGPRRVLDITNISSLIVYDLTPPAPELGVDGAGRRPASLQPDAGAEPASQNSMVRSSVDVVDAALRLVTALAGATLHNADGVSVTLERHGRLMTVAATDDAVLTMDRHQYETGEGPCLDAKAEGRWFYAESLADESRWPAFAPLALEQGIHSILSSPLLTRDRPQGALNIYSSSAKAFGTREQELAALFAAQASEILTTADEGRSDEQSSQLFAEALATRQVIHQAQGVIMARDRVSANEAIRSLIIDARSHDATVLSRALDLVGSLHVEGEE